MAGMIEHHLAQRLQHVHAGIGVVADVGHSLRSQIGTADGKERLAYLWSHPGVDAMGDDIVKLPQGRGHIAHIEREKAHIPQSKGSDGSIGICNLLRRQVDSHKVAPGQAVRHGQEVSAGGTSQLQHAAALYRCRLHAQEPCTGGQPVRVSGRVTQDRVGYLIATCGGRSR